MIKTTNKKTLNFIKQLKQLRSKVNTDLDGNESVATDTKYMEKLNQLLINFFGKDGSDYIEYAGFTTKAHLISDIKDKIQDELDDGDSTMDSSMSLDDVRNSNGKWFDSMDAPVDNSEIVDTINYVLSAIENND